MSRDNLGGPRPHQEKGPAQNVKGVESDSERELPTGTGTLQDTEEETRGLIPRKGASVKERAVVAMRVMGRRYWS